MPLKYKIDVLSALKENERPESPGMKYRHYAPKAPVTMVRGREEDVLSFFRKKLSEGCGILCYDEDLEALSSCQNDLLISFGSRDNLLSQACGLFDALRSFDRKKTNHIYARETATDDLGLAISNRLLRACAFDVLEVST